MSTAAFPMRSMAESTCSTLDISSASRGERAASTDLTHRVGEIGQPLLELVDLVGHLGVGEEERGVREIDHELGGVLRLREHRLEIAGLIVGCHALRLGWSQSG